MFALLSFLLISTETMPAGILPQIAAGILGPVVRNTAGALALPLTISAFGLLGVLVIVRFRGSTIRRGRKHRRPRSTHRLSPAIHPRQRNRT